MILIFATLAGGHKCIKESAQTQVDIRGSQQKF